MPPLRGVAGRLDRALRNFMEDVSVVRRRRPRGPRLGHTQRLTERGARLYLWARVAYVPLYAAGVSLLRSLVWNVVTLGIVLLVVALLLG